MPFSNNKMPNAKTKKANKQTATILVSAPRQKIKKRKSRRPKNRRVIARGFSGGGAQFIRASLDPFADIQLNGVGIPDDFGGNTLKLKQYMSIPVKPDANGNIQFSVIGCPTGCIAATAGTYTFAQPDLNVNTYPVGAYDPVVDFPPVAGQGTYLPVIPFPAWAQFISQGQSSVQGGPYSFNDYRVVGMGIEIRYTGTTLNDSGLIYCARVECQPREGRMTTPTRSTTLTQLANDAVWVRETQLPDLNSPSGAMISNVEGFRTQRVCEGALIVMTNATGGTEFVPYDQQTVYMQRAYDNDSSSGQCTMGIWCRDKIRTPATEIPAIYPMPSWAGYSPMLVAIQGMDPTQSIEIRVVQYLEATLQPSSPFQQFTSKSPMYDQSALETVATVQKTLPVMVPVSMNSFGDWWKKIMGVIGGVGKTIGGLGIPMVSQVAGGVGNIADILGSFASM